MKVRSPENGFDEIRDLYKDNESSLLEDLDLSFIINKDLASGYLFDDLAGYDTYNFRFNEQGQPELPSLPLSFGDYDIPGPSTDDLNSTAESACHVDVLPDSDVIQDQNLLYEPNQHKSYIATSGFQVELDSVDLDHEFQKVSHAEFVATLDDDLIINKVDGISSLPPDETVEKTCFEVIQEKMKHFDLCFTEENEASISHFREFLPNSSEHQFDLESEVRHINDSKNRHDENEEPKCADMDENQDQEYPASLNSLLNLVDSDTSLVQRHQQVECFDQNEDTHSQQDVRQKSGSSHSSGKMSQQLESSPATQDARSSENLAVKRSVSPSTIGSKMISCWECLENSREIKSSSAADDCSISRKRKREVAGNSFCVGEVTCKELANSSNSQYHKYDLDGCCDQDRGDTPNSSWQNSTFSQELQQNIQESSSSKQSHAPPRDKYSRRSSKRARRSVSPPFVRKQDRYSEYRKERNRSRSRGSPYGRDHPRTRYSPRRRYPSRSYSSRPRSPALFRRTGLGKPGSCLFVAGFCFLTSERELVKKFSRFGRVRDVRIIRDKRSGKSRGYGFLSLERSEEADAAIRAIHKTKWNGRMMLVEKSIPK